MFSDVVFWLAIIIAAILHVRFFLYFGKRDSKSVGITPLSVFIFISTVVSMISMILIFFNWFFVLEGAGESLILDSAQAWCTLGVILLIEFLVYLALRRTMPIDSRISAKKKMFDHHRKNTLT